MTHVFYRALFKSFKLNTQPISEKSCKLAHMHNMVSCSDTKYSDLVHLNKKLCSRSFQNDHSHTQKVTNLLINLLRTHMQQVGSFALQIQKY